MGSLETSTVLFTDLVGSTGLATRVGPGAAESLRRDHFAILRGAVETTGGREVKNVGDGLMVVFTSSSAAVGCAVEMQQRIERRNRKADEQFSVRIGISMGEADVEEGDYFGPPVVEAARLCSAAAGGQILCGDLVRATAREGHEFRPLGLLDLKGLPEPFSAHEVDWQPAEDSAHTLPLPPRLREVPPVGYVGRDVEREGLTFLFDQVREGARRVALISGEPGIGKTRLATQLAVHGHGDGATVLYGRCDEDLGVPYGPWVRALRHYVTEAPDEILRAHAEQYGGELAQLAPEIRTRVPGYPEPRETDPETERYLLLGAVTSLLEVATRDAPMVLILDDLHWADSPSLSLLRHVATHDAPLRLLVLGTYRDAELATDHPLAVLLADLHREEGVSRIPLSGLEEDHVVTLMEAAAGHELTGPGRRLAQAIVRETDGNPFYVAELLRHLREAGALVQGADGRFRIEGRIEDLGLPQSVREVVGRRVKRLSEPSRQALAVAAVIGRDFDVDLLARVLETDEDSLLDLLEEAAAASVVDEALRWFGQGLELRGETRGDPAEHCDLLIGLGEAQRQVGDPAHRETLLAASEIAGELGDADRAARAALSNHRGWNSVFGEVDRERIAAIERAVELDAGRNPARSARLIARQAVELQFDRDYERRWALAEEALAMARRSGDARTLGNVLFDYIYANTSRVGAAEVRVLTDELLEIVGSLDDPALHFRTTVQEAIWLVIEGKLADAEVEIARLRTIAPGLGQPVVRWFATYFDAAFRAITGDLEESERLAEEALRIGTEAGQPDAAMIYGAEITPIRTMQDRVGEFIPLFEQAAADNPGLPVWRAALANVYATVGRIDDAAEIVADFARNRFTDVPYDQARFSALVVLAHAVYETRDREAAAMLYELLEPWADAVVWNGANSYPQIRMYLGMLASVLGQGELADENPP